MADLSDYERVRAENIARNEEFLTEIGIGDVKPRTATASKKSKEAKAKKPRGTNVVIPIDPLTVRRSSRVAALPIEHTQLSYADVSDYYDEDVKKGIRYGCRKRGYTASASSADDAADGASACASASASVSASVVSKYTGTPVVMGENRSSREVKSNYDFFIGTTTTEESAAAAAAAPTSKSKSKSRSNAGTDTGNDDVDVEEKEATSSSSSSSSSNSSNSSNSSSSSSTSSSNNNLANFIDSVGFGKAAVMAASYNDRCPKFSKYSGVVEWANCVYLWVNLGSKNPGEFINVFTEQGRYMTWYGGSRMHAESPITSRLLPPGTVNTTSIAPAPKIKANKNNKILLFVRLEHEHYICLGPVVATAYNIDTHPIEFTWELQMFEQLKNRDNFKRTLMNA